MLGTQQSQILGGTSNLMNAENGQSETELVETRIMKPSRGRRIKRMARGGKPRTAVRGGIVGMQQAFVRSGTIGIQGRTTRSALQQRQTMSKPQATVQEPR